MGVMGGVFVIAVMLFGIACQLHAANEQLREMRHSLKGRSKNQLGTQ